MCEESDYSKFDFELDIEVIKACFHSKFRKFYLEAYKKYFIPKHTNIYVYMHTYVHIHVYVYTHIYEEASYCFHDILKQALLKCCSFIQKPEARSA